MSDFVVRSLFSVRLIKLQVECQRQLALLDKAMVEIEEGRYSGDTFYALREHFPNLAEMYFREMNNYLLQQCDIQYNGTVNAV